MILYLLCLLGLLRTICVAGFNAYDPQILDLITDDIRRVSPLNAGNMLQRDAINNWNFWKKWLQESSDDIIGSVRISLSDREWWWNWMRLSPSIREDAVSTFLHMLVERNDFTLHCSDAYKLCLADRNCRWKYWNFLNSCSSENIPLEDWAALSILEQNLMLPSVRIRRASQSYKYPTSGRGTKKFRGRKIRRRKGKGKFKFRNHSSRRYHRNFRQTTEKMHYWMGRYWPNIYDDGVDNKDCSVKCHNALLMLNRTIYSTLLAKCECSAKNMPNRNVSANAGYAWDESKCRSEQEKALACRPRVYKPQKAVIGCTESRLRCENDPRCSLAQRRFLLRCSQVISGVTCSKRCKDAIENLASASQHFNTCVCDGTERRVCSGIRSSIKSLCTPKRNCSESGQGRQKRDVINKYESGCEMIRINHRTKKSIAFYPIESSAYRSPSCFWSIFSLFLLVLLFCLI